MATDGGNKLVDSTSKWKYVVLVSRFFTMFIAMGLSKSFGVLITEMVDRYDTTFAKMAPVCRIPLTAMFLCCKY